MNTYTSRIATIVYENYTENVDMNNEYFKQSELDKLVKTDKSIIRVDYYIDGVLVKGEFFTSKKALTKVISLDKKIGDTLLNMETDGGYNWIAKNRRNNQREGKIYRLLAEIRELKNFVTEKDFNESTYDFCMSYEDFIN